MWWGSVLLMVGVLVLVLVVVLVPHPAADWDAPLNLAVFRAPGPNRYSEQLVNLWVPKAWRTDDATQRIPCRIEHGYRPSVPLAERKLILYSHGNAEDLMSCTQFLRELAERVGMDVVTWDYSGYGLNPAQKFERTTEGVNLSLKTVLDAVCERGYRRDHILLWGYSLGTGPSTALAAALSRRQETIAGLILFGAYTSILDVVRQHTPGWVAGCFEERWNSREAIAAVTCPILLMHGQSDGLIPAQNSQHLLQAAAADRAKLVLFPNVGHTQFSWMDAMKEVSRWLQENHIQP